MFASLAFGVASRGVAAFSAGSQLRSKASLAAAYPTSRAFSTKSSLQMANVLKLTDPQTQLLDQVDVFIFDCDGVIWRVRYTCVFVLFPSSSFCLVNCSFFAHLLLSFSLLFLAM